MAGAEHQGELLPVTVRFRVLGETHEATAPVPRRPIRPDELLPLLQTIDNLVVDRAIAHSEAAGKPISCCRGCSACCRAQPVPVTPAEAYALWRLVEKLPEPRRGEIKSRFADRASRLHAEGLAQVYLDRDPNLTSEAARTVARQYFSLGLVCPFLEDDACGIYESRPLVCRQYLVTSPAELCRDPLSNLVEVLPMPIAAAGALLQASSQTLGRDQFTIPLTLALEYAEQNREELERTFEPDVLLGRCIAALGNVG
jgi:Fe-S-cluster containining protein